MSQSEVKHFLGNSQKRQKTFFVAITQSFEIFKHRRSLNQSRGVRQALISAALILNFASFGLAKSLLAFCICCFLTFITCPLSLSSHTLPVSVNLRDSNSYMTWKWLNEWAKAYFNFAAAPTQKLPFSSGERSITSFSQILNFQKDILKLKVDQYLTSWAYVENNALKVKIHAYVSSDW